MKVTKAINDRRQLLGIPIAYICNRCGWLSRDTYYRKIKSMESIWTLEELINLLNLFNCTFEELFIEGVIKEKYNPHYWVKRDLLNTILRRARLEEVKKTELYASFGGKGSRQNFYQRINNQKLKLCQIFNLTQLLNTTFADLFLQKIQFTVYPNLLEDKDII